MYSHICAYTLIQTCSFKLLLWLFVLSAYKYEYVRVWESVFGSCGYDGCVCVWYTNTNTMLNGLYIFITVITQSFHFNNWCFPLLILWFGSNLSTLAVAWSIIEKDSHGTQWVNLDFYYKVDCWRYILTFRVYCNLHPEISKDRLMSSELKSMHMCYNSSCCIRWLHG